MEFDLTFRRKRSDIKLPKPKDWVYLTVVALLVSVSHSDRLKEMISK